MESTELCEQVRATDSFGSSSLFFNSAGSIHPHLSLEKDLDNTSRFIEPRGQENVFSFEFAKLLVLSCTELESVLKLLCYERSGETKGNFGEYKETILTLYPKIVFAEVSIARWGETIRPFGGWDKGKLSWWDAYGNVKHNRKDNFTEATYKNVVYALSALYISIFYLSQETGVLFSDYDSTYIESNYSARGLAVAKTRELPDFDPDFIESAENSSAARSVAMIYRTEGEPQENIGEDGDILFQIEKDRG